jgi:hypothetical protein
MSYVISFFIVIYIALLCNINSVCWKSRLQLLHYPFYAVTIICHVYHGLAKHSSDHFEHTRIEVTLIMDATGWPTKACLTCVAVYQVEFSPHGNPGARLFVLVHDEGAVFETKVLVVFGKEPVITIIIKKRGRDNTYIGKIFSFNLSLGLV